VPIEDVAGAVKASIQQGKVKHFGLSEPACRPSVAHTRSAGRGLQSEYSLGRESLEAEVIPTLEELGSGSFHSALLRGFLTGKSPKYQVDSTDFRTVVPRFTQKTASE